METKQKRYRWSAFLLPLIALLIFSACGGGGGSLDPDPNPNPQLPSGQWEGTVATSSAVNPGFTGVPELPLDLPGHTSSDIGTLELVGSEYLQKLNAVVDGTSLVLTASGDSASLEDPISYGLYTFTGLGEVEPQYLNIECLPRELGESYYVLLADFTVGDWAWFGPVTFPEFELNLQDLNHRFVTELGNMYFVVLCGPGNGATLSRSVLTIETGGVGGGDDRLPGIPRNLEATDGEFDDRVVVEWREGDGASGYEIWRKLHDGEDWVDLGEGTEPRYVDESVEPGVVYVYKARSFNDAGYSEFSNHDPGYAGDLGGEGDPPGQPFEIWASDGAHPEHVVIEWGYEGEYDYFELWRRLFEGGDFEHIASIDGENFRYEDWEVDPGVVYKYKVRVIKGDVEGPFSEYDTGFAGDNNHRPTAPFSLTATDGEFEEKIRVRWMMEGEWDYFKIFRKLEATDGPFEMVAEVEAMEFNDFDVLPEHEYLYKATNVLNNQESDHSNIDGGYAGDMGGGDPDVPGDAFNLHASKGEFYEKIELGWEVEGEYDFFEVWRRTDDRRDGFEKIGISQNLEYSDTEFPGDFTFHYKVRAILGDLEGEFSNEDFGYLKDGVDPNQPFDLVASDGNYEDKVRIEWMMEGDWSYFQLYRKVDAPASEWDLLADVEAMEYDDFAVDSDVVYLYYAVALVGEEEIGRSNTDSGYAGTNNPGDPDAPYDLEVSKGTFLDKIDVWWSFDGDFDHFEVWRRTEDLRDDFTMIGTTEGLEYSDTDLPGDYTFVYKVRAILGDYESPFSNTDYGYLQDDPNQGGSNPYDLIASDGIFEDKVRIEWMMEGDWSAFLLYRKVDAPASEWDLLADVDAMEYDDFAVDSDVVYLYHVVAIMGDTQSDASNTDSGYAGSGNPGDPR